MNMASNRAAVGSGMRFYGLMYHDVQRDPPPDRAGGRSYTVSLRTFAEHVQAMSNQVQSTPTTKPVLHCQTPQWALTFDDGGLGALHAADVLESMGWKAYFFIVSSWLGSRGFLNRSQVCDLRDRGHVIGSHSLTHPAHMAGLPKERLQQEWRQSVEDLSELLGHPIESASVPGGSLSARVVAAAAEAGVSVLFTSEPVRRVRHTQECVLIGRYAIRNSTNAATAAALATGNLGACTTQWVDWNSRKLPKMILGSSYCSIRSRILGRRDGKSS